MRVLIEKTDIGFSKQLNKVAGKIDDYKVLLEISAGDVTSLKNDAVMTRFVFNNQQDTQDFAQSHSEYKKKLRYGGEIGQMPTPPVFTTVPTLVAGNVEERFRTFTGRIIVHRNFTKAIGEDLGIIAPETPFNPNNGKPKFDIAYSTAGHPVLRWIKGEFQGVEIWKDSGTGFVKMDRDNSPDYIDKTPLPPYGSSVLWKYKMIYFYKDEIVGHWSSEEEISVLGEV